MFKALADTARAAADTARAAAVAAKDAALLATAPRAFREYEADTEGPPTATAGPWSIYAARYRRQKGGGVKHPAASLWILHKATVGGDARAVAAAKRGVSALARVRHPSFVRVIEPVEENKTMLVFVSEAVTASAHDACLGGSPDPPSMLEVKAGLVSVAAGLRFLHVDASPSIAVGDVTPSSLLLTVAGGWKVGPMPHAAPLGGAAAAAVDDGSLPAPAPIDWGAPGPAAAATRPDATTVAPERLAKDGASVHATAASDVYAWAATGVQLVLRERVARPPTTDPSLPPGAWAALAPCMAPAPASRPPTASIAAAPWFAGDGALTTIARMADIAATPTTDAAARSAAWADAAALAPSLTPRARRTLILPHALAAARAPDGGGGAAAAALPVLLTIVTQDTLPPGFFDDVCLPSLRPLAAHATGDALAALVRAAPALARRRGQAAAADTLIPLVCRALDAADAAADARSLADALTAVPAVGEAAGSAPAAEHLLPRAHRAALATTSATVRAASLRAAAALAAADQPRDIAVNFLTNTLARVTAVDASPTTAAAAVAAVDALVCVWGPSLAATAGIPALCPLLTTRDGDTFDAVCGSIRKHLASVEAARGDRLVAATRVAAATTTTAARGDRPATATRAAAAMTTTAARRLASPPRVSSIDLDDFGALTTPPPPALPPPPPPRPATSSTGGGDAFSGLLGAAPAPTARPARLPSTPLGGAPMRRPAQQAGQPPPPGGSLI